MDALGEVVHPQVPAEATHRSLEIETEHALKGEQETGVTVLYGEREAKLAISRSEFALEVSSPGAVAVCGMGRGGCRDRVAAQLARLDAPVTHEDAVNRIAAGNVLDGRIILEQAPDLRAPQISRW